MNLDARDCLKIAIEPALWLMPVAPYDTPGARAMLLAIAMQESHLEYRRQRFGGPARSYWQFELIGVVEVFANRVSHALAEAIAVRLDYPPSPNVIHSAMEDNDVLAAAVARLALWRHPSRLPSRNEPGRGWEQYLRIWAPGKPRPEEWPGNFALAWEIVS